MRRSHFNITYDLIPVFNEQYMSKKIIYKSEKRLFQKLLIAGQTREKRNLNNRIV